MSIKFKVIERGQPGVVGGGTKKFYAIPVMNGEFDLKGLTTAIEKNCTVSGADIRAVLYALVDVSIDRLAQGTIVRLGDLGSLRVSFSAQGQAAADDVLVRVVLRVAVPDHAVKYADLPEALHAVMLGVVHLGAHRALAVVVEVADLRPDFGEPCGPHGNRLGEHGGCQAV